jgi:ABC-type transport system involved in resistance to organic solvents, periplasmic component
MKFRIRHADKIVGLFVLLAALSLAAGAVVFGSSQRWFAKDGRYAARFASAAGAGPGAAIMMRGFQVGKIARVRLNDANQVDAEIVIYEEYLPKVRRYSLLELVTSPIGLGTQLLFHPGKGPESLPQGGFLPLADSDEGKDIIERGLADVPTKDDTITRLLAGVNPLIENAGKTVVSVNQTLSEVNRALAGQSSGPLGSIVTDASKAVARANGLVSNASNQVESIAGKANALVDTVNSIATDLKGTSEALKDPTGLVPRLLGAKGSVATLLDDDNKLYDGLAKSVAGVQASVKSIQDMTASLNAQMPSIELTIDEGRTAIKQAQDVLTGLKNNPILKGGIPERVEQKPLSQSLREGAF